MTRGTLVIITQAARLQRLYEPVLEAVLAQQPAWASHSAPRIEKAWEAAASAGLNVEKARAAMMKPEITAVLEQDMADLKASGVKATPPCSSTASRRPASAPIYDLVSAAKCWPPGPVRGRAEDRRRLGPADGLLEEALLNPENPLYPSRHRNASVPFRPFVDDVAIPESGYTQV